MGLAVLILVLALLLGGVGLFVEALRWVIIIAVVLLLAGLLPAGWAGPGLSRAPSAQSHGRRYDR